MNRIVAICATVTLLSACADSPPVPETSFYRLSPPAGVAQQILSEGVVKVLSFEAGGLYKERAVLYSDDQAGRVLRQHHYHFWQDSPGRLLQAQLVAYLRAAGAAPMVMTDARVDADLAIRGRVYRWERRLAAGSVWAAVGLELRLDEVGAEEPLLVRTYATETPVSGGDVADAIEAFDRAVGELFDRFLQDAREAVLRR